MDDYGNVTEQKEVDALRARVAELEARLAWYMTINLSKDDPSAELEELRRKWAGVPWDTLCHLVAYPWAGVAIPDSERDNWGRIFDWLTSNAPK